jgi:hypothetical protein
LFWADLCTSDTSFIGFHPHQNVARHAQNGITEHFDEVCAKNSDSTETCVTGDELKLLLATPAAAGAPGARSGATDGASTSAEHAVHLDAEPSTVTDNRDESATSSSQVLVPAIDLAPPANDNNPTDNTLLVDVPAAPEPPPAVAAPEAIQPAAAPANNNTPIEQLSATGTDG